MFFLYPFICEFDANLPPLCRVVHKQCNNSGFTNVSRIFIIIGIIYSYIDLITNSAINDSYLRNPIRSEYNISCNC